MRTFFKFFFKFFKFDGLVFAGITIKKVSNSTESVCLKRQMRRESVYAILTNFLFKSETVHFNESQSMPYARSNVNQVFV